MEGVKKNWGFLIVILCCLASSYVYANKTHHHAHHAHYHRHHHHRHHFTNFYHPNYQVSSVINGQQELLSEINRIIDHTHPDVNVGIEIKSMRNSETLYARNNQRIFVPASILKIFTAESALLMLGPEYKFSTSFVTDANSIDNNAVHGNLYLILTGDPSLTYYDLEDLVTELKARHIQQINGNVFIDNTAYDQEIYGPGWVWNDKRFCYAAPISASIINHNCLSYPIKSKIRSAQSPLSRYSIGGSVITDIMYYNKLLISSLFDRYGIEINGSILGGAAPSTFSSLSVHQSKPLHELITQMLKKSDNIIAGSIFKKLGEVYTKQPGSWQNGSQAVTNILSKKMGVNVWGINITDGSGLSRYNLVSPSQMMGVLDFAYHHDQTSYQFISALPVAGVDGTLKHRLYNVAWKVRAKTGTMSGVMSLAGYAIDRDRDALAFVIIINGHSGLSWKYRSLEDNIVTALTHYAR